MRIEAAAIQPRKLPRHTRSSSGRQSIRRETKTRRWRLASELNVLALIKGQERYIFVYDEASRGQLIDTIRDYAADAQVNLSWFDAMVLTNKAREQENESATCDVAEAAKPQAAQEEIWTKRSQNF